jgi:hypothetical protein
MNEPLTALLPLAALCASAHAQGPWLTMTPAVSIAAPNPTVTWRVQGPMPQSYVVLADLSGGPSHGGDLLLGPNASTVLHFGPPGTGVVQGGFPVPALPLFVGTVVYAQILSLDPSAQNGIFRPGNGASVAVHGAPSAIVADFANPVAAGFQGQYRDDVIGHVRGGAVTRRTHETYDPSAAQFTSAIQSPLVPTGCREQMVFRPADVGATGQPELLTAVRWLVRGIVVPDSFLQYEMRIGHSHVHPDYSVDPWSALPIAPGSGLSATFANNEITGAPPVTVAMGRYDLDPADVVVHALGMFLPYPAIAPFRYDGQNSLLLDIRAGQGGSGNNGMAVQLMLQSSPLPAARAVAGGTIFFPLPLPNPGAATTANNIDCAMPILQFDFARTETHAVSGWFDAGTAAPDFAPAILGLSTPPGTHVELRYRGSHSAAGSSPTAWSASVDAADGYRFLQIDIALHGNPLSGEVPLVDTLVVPVY